MRHNCWTCIHADTDLDGAVGTCNAYTIDDDNRDAALQAWIDRTCSGVVDGVAAMPEHHADGCPEWEAGDGVDFVDSLTKEQRHALTCLERLSDDEAEAVIAAWRGGR